MEWLAGLLKTFARPFQWWVTVGPWERGLLIRLGKTAKDLAPGIHFRIPFLDRVYVQSVRLRTIWDTGITVGTRDGHTMTVAIAIDFAIADMRQMFNSLSSPEVTLKYRASSGLVAFASHLDKADLTVDAIERSINESLSSFECGLSQIRARITALAFPRTYRLMINDYSTSAGLFHDFERQPGGTV